MDDYIALQTIIWYTLLVVAINRIVFGGGKLAKGGSPMLMIQDTDLGYRLQLYDTRRGGRTYA